jgi:ArsR family transcriptional regulator
VCCAGTTCELLPAREAADLAEVFKALADPTRVRLLHYLSASVDGTACACHLPTALGVSQPTLSFHMRKLHDAGLVSRDKRGRWVHYTVQAKSLALVRTFLEIATPVGAPCC